LAYRRHFPAINWLTSYSLYTDKLASYFDELVKGFSASRTAAMALLQKEAELKEIVQLVGPDALPQEDKLVLDTTKSLREDYLQQNAYHDVDTFCEIKKQNLMLKVILDTHELGLNALRKGVKANDLAKLVVKEKIARMKYTKDLEKDAPEITREVNEEIKKLQSKINQISVSPEEGN
jgi:V/A-type H+-transporting ATPase subunit A